MSRSTPSKRFSENRKQIVVLLLVLSLISLLAGWDRSQADVTISGLRLGMSYQDVLNRLGPPSFREGATPSSVESIEYWGDPSTITPTLKIAFDGLNQVCKLEGGRPETDGVDVTQWDLRPLERALGPPSGVSSSQSLSRGSDERVGESTLQYKERGLLVTWSASKGTSFLLFRRQTDL